MDSRNKLTIDKLLKKVSKTDNDGGKGSGSSKRSKTGLNAASRKTILDYMDGDRKRVSIKAGSTKLIKSDKSVSVAEQKHYSREFSALRDFSIREWRLSENMNFVDEVSGYVIDVKYDGDLGKAVVFIYSPDDGKIYRWIDKTGHKPYFLTDKTPEELKREKLDIEMEDSFRGFEIVSRFHPIKRKNLRLTKIIVNDPLAVKNLRSKFDNRGISYWEADIKYHHNYIYDNLLIPGMPYTASSKLEINLLQDYAEDDTRINEILSSSDPNTRNLVKGWIPLFEHKPIDVPRIAVDIEVYTPEEGRIPNIDEAAYPVISIGLADNRGMRKVLVLAHGSSFEKWSEDLDSVDIELFDDERSMLLELFRIIEEYPVILTFNGDSFDLPYIYNRLLNLGIDPRFIPIEFHKTHVSFRHSLHVDLYKLFDIRALQVYAFGNKYREKNLDAIASALLGISKIEIPDIVARISLDKLIAYNIRDADLTIKLTTFNNNLVWNLVQLIMRISKLGLEDVTRTQVLAWIRNLLNWEHRRRKWLIPNKNDIKVAGEKARSQAIIKEKKYKGAIVLEPPQGIFFNIVVLDFASLYPSIISNWNLSYETVNNPYCKDYITVPIVEHKICKSIKGISSEIVGLLRDFRVKVYKKKAKQDNISNVERAWYDTVQSAMKVYINASYGVFGNDTFNLYSLPLAESVTAIGRNVLNETLKKASEMDIIILYGDTDSLFIWDPPRDKLEKLTEYVREKYGLELELDKEFAVVIFSGLKKNYMGITKGGDIIIKGMVGKKSNTPEFIKKEFNKAVNIIAKLREPEQADDIIEELRSHINEVYRKLRNKEYTLDELAIRVMLSKDLSEYTKNTPQHVKAAMLLKKKGIVVNKGTIISYVKTKDRMGIKPVKLAKLQEVDTSKYMDYIKTAFEQILLALGIKWEELSGTKRLEDLL